MSMNWADETENEEQSHVGSYEKKTEWKGWNKPDPKAQRPAEPQEPAWPVDNKQPQNKPENDRQPERYRDAGRGRGDYERRSYDDGADRRGNGREGGYGGNRGGRGNYEQDIRGRRPNYGGDGGRGGYERDRGYDRDNDRRGGDGGERRGYDRDGDERRGSFERSEGAPYERRERPAREPLPLPTSPPYTAFIGNLDFSIHEDDIRQFFEPDCKIVSVRVPVERETGKIKGFGYVVFDDLESLKIALQRNEQELLNRPIKVDIAAEREGRRDGGGRGESSFWGNNRPPREPVERERRAPEVAERVPLNLKPRSSGQEDTSSGSPAPSDTKSKSNPFGAAKPRDESEYQRRAEERRKEREEEEQRQREKERAEKEAKQASDFTMVASKHIPEEKKEVREADKRSHDIRDNKPPHFSKDQNRDRDHPKDRSQNNDQRKNFKDARPQQRADSKASTGKPFDPHRGNKDKDVKKPEPKPIEKKAEEPRAVSKKPPAPVVKPKVEDNANMFAVLEIDDVECP